MGFQIWKVKDHNVTHIPNLPHPPAPKVLRKLGLDLWHDEGCSTHVMCKMTLKKLINVTHLKTYLRASKDAPTFLI